MKSIQSSLQHWMKDNDTFQARHNAMKKKILDHPQIKAFLTAHPEITDKDIDKKLNKLHEYITQSIQCADCEDYPNCKNIVQGYSPTLQYRNGEIHLAYEKCSNHLQYEKEAESKKLVQSIAMPKEIMQARMDDIKLDQHRVEAIKAITLFLDDAKSKLPEKGFYFSGPFGVGKTYFLGAIANRLKRLNISTVLVYMPELVREMHSSIKDNTVQQKVEFFKSAEVLMIDDIGAETMSAWFRDEVLGAILQYRMMEKLPVFFTSNYTMQQLEKILASSTNGPIETVKAGRIMERLKRVSKEIYIDGENRRN